MWLEEGCTVALVLGRATVDDRVYVIKNRDVPSLSSPEIIQLIKKEGSLKVLGISSSEDKESFTMGLNEGGLTINTAGRYCYEANNLGLGGGTIIVRTLTAVAEARKAAEMIMDLVKKEGKSKNGTAFACVDRKEAYVVEAYQRKSEVIGPLTDDLFAYGNYMLAETMKPFERKSRGRGEKRVRRAKSFLEARRGSVSILHLFKVLRDHETEPDLTLPWDDRNICTHGYERDTRGSGVCVIDRHFPRYLSSLWACLNLPCLTPYLPFYIGMEEIPPEFASHRAYEVFESLSVAANKAPSLKPEIRAFWEAFEFQTVREAVVLEERIHTFCQHGDDASISEMATNFVFEKSRSALQAAEKMVKRIKHKSIW